MLGIWKLEGCPAWGGFQTSSSWMGQSRKLQQLIPHLTAGKSGVGSPCYPADAWQDCDERMKWMLTGDSLEVVERRMG